MGLRMSAYRRAKCPAFRRFRLFRSSALRRLGSLLGTRLGLRARS